jgi:hypothetical protein
MVKGDNVPQHIMERPQIARSENVNILDICRPPHVEQQKTPDFGWLKATCLAQ